jgi:hypothetical protein
VRNALAVEQGLDFGLQTGDDDASSTRRQGAHQIRKRPDQRDDE